jgi:hypothetical protein
MRESRLAEMVGANRRLNPLNLMWVMPPKVFLVVELKEN